VAAVDVVPSSEGDTGVDAPDMSGVWSSSCFSSNSAAGRVSALRVRGVQAFLCAGQSVFWHLGEQYITDLQREHCLRMFSDVAGVKPQLLQVRTLVVSVKVICRQHLGGEMRMRGMHVLDLEDFLTKPRWAVRGLTIVGLEDAVKLLEGQFSVRGEMLSRAVVLYVAILLWFVAITIASTYR
jgi:hypothetical protein